MEKTSKFEWNFFKSKKGFIENFTKIFRNVKVVLNKFQENMRKLYKFYEN